MIIFLGFTFFVVGLVLAIMATRRPRFVRSAGMPCVEPRIPYYLDAWQTVIFGAGADADEIKSRLMALFSTEHQRRFSCMAERAWCWGLTGKQVREHIVLGYGRGLVFCQVYSYGADLYVGWDAKMNIGAWVEKEVASGVDRETKERVRIMTVERGTQATTEYDLVDINCLLEWVHAQIVQVLKLYIRERQIDQEIDFKIIRGDRQRATRVDEKQVNSFQRTA